MHVNIKKRLLILAATQLIIGALSFIIYQKFTLLSYINISFIISAILLLFGVLAHIIHAGFFDVMSKSLNLAFSRNRGNRKFHEVPGLSELITINQKPLFFYGLTIGFLMLIALIIFYI